MILTIGARRQIGQPIAILSSILILTTGLQVDSDSHFDSGSEIDSDSGSILTAKLILTTGLKDLILTPGPSIKATAHPSMQPEHLQENAHV